MDRRQRLVQAEPAGCSAGRDLFDDALRHHQAGRLDEAITGYGRVLDLDPDRLQARNNLGNALMQQGRLGEAVTCLRSALDLDPEVPETHYNLGLALMGLDRAEAAAFCFRRALELRAAFPEAHYNLGIALRELGRVDEAIACYGNALVLRPEFPQVHNDLGVVFRERGQLEAAAACLRRAIQFKPDFADAHNNLGNVFMAQGCLDAALAGYAEALVLDPEFADACNNLGTVFMQQGRLHEAAACFCRSIELNRSFPEPHNNLGTVFRHQGRLEEAIACCHSALALRPDFPEANYNLGNAHQEQGRLDEAVTDYARALDAAPDFANAHNNLGVVLRQQGRAGEAVECYRKAIDLDDGFSEAHNNLAMALLAQGDMGAGWKEYEWRWKTLHLVEARRDFAQPQWNGEAAAGRTLLIHAEQGFGDTLQFCRYAPLAAARGWRVILEVQKPLVRLLQCLTGVDLVLARGDPLPSFDLHCPMLSLPLAMRTSLATVPASGSYLRADDGQVAAWGSRLAAMADRGLRVGLAWAGNPRLHSPGLAALDRRRSLPPERLAPLSGLPGVQLFSLQKDGPEAPSSMRVADFMAEMDDFADTAALVTHLDLVISVDSAMAHLAAALGRPVWLLDRFDPCWRWLMGRRDSPWYPTLRLVRQPRPGDWDAVLAEVRAGLSSLTG